MTAPPARPSRRTVLAGSALGLGTAALAGAGSVDPASAAAAPRPAGTLDAASRRRRRHTLFGIGYETWFGEVSTFQTAEAEPQLGFYDSHDHRVIDQHARWIAGAGFDFILIDWSNNLGGNWTNGTAEKIIDGTMALLERYTRLTHRPRFALLLGLDNGKVDTPNFTAQISQIERTILNKPAYARMWQRYDGKPLLGVYRGPSFDDSPTWSHPRFTSRILGAFHETTMNPWGDWSWTDRNPYIGGAMTPISPWPDSGFGGWQADGNWSFTSDFPVGRFPTTKPALAASTGSLVSPSFRVTERFVTFAAAGADLFSTVRTDYSKGRALDHNVFLLQDAKTGEVLRHALPPGIIAGGTDVVVPTGIKTGSEFRLRQWDVTDLIGRDVVFAAVSNSTAGGATLGWMAFAQLAQTRGEQMTAAIGNEGIAAPGWTDDWDAQRRGHGATLVRYMDAAFRAEPEVALVLQWNEFGAPDQYSPDQSNDMEPTKLRRLNGAQSDGWGTYYLDLTRTLISQYRRGLRYPQVLLDTRYP